ncbi:MAG TPA: homoserine dehydrogenase [Methylomirabilota bacterium]|jgi:homoserine dehydrogenase|nr:homoserine dehydrogenase [Methylomirabilota bacterium]
MKEIGIGLLGIGTVGGGVLKIHTQNRAGLEAKAGCGLRISAVVDRDITTPRPGLTLTDWPLTPDVDRVLADPGVAIVIELIGGLEPARTFILRAMAAGKQVVTANKALVATHGPELFEAARRRGVLLGFEAAVAGGVPIIRALRDGLAANRILSLYGIVNGTSNYILTKMTDEGREFREVLAEAQAAGYAEADPTLDIEGIDSAHKLQILASLAFRTAVDLKEVHTEGISRITPEEIANARELGYRIKLLAIAKAAEGALEARVHPTMIPARSPLSAVSGVFNAIFVAGDAVGDQMFYGRGAGQMPTASAVWSDVIEIARRLAHAHGALPEDLPLVHPAGAGGLRLRPMDEIRSAYYLRVMAQDRPGVLSQVAGVLGRHEISITSVLQKERHHVAAVPVVMMTHEAQERNVRAALEEIDRLPVVAGQTVMLRVEAQ